MAGDDISSGRAAELRDQRLGARIRRIANDPLAQLVVLVLIMALRNLLELLGPLTGSTNFCCFYPSVGSFLNTLTYELLLLYGGIFLVHVVLRGTREQLQRLIVASILFMLPLFVFVPLCNLVLNYHGPRIPIFLVWGFYLPMGSALGFAAIGVGLPLVMRRIYPERPLWRLLLALLVGFAAMFGWTYVGALFLAYNPAVLWLNGPGVDRMDLYSLTFVAPLLLVYPLYLRWTRPRRWGASGWAVYVLAVVGCSAYLTYSSKVVTAENRAFPPLICEQIVVPYQPPGATVLAPRDPRRRWMAHPAAARLAQAISETGRRDGHRFGPLRRYSRAHELGLDHRLAYLVYPKRPSALFHAAVALREGEVSKAVDTGRAFRVLRRVATPDTIHVAHIFIAINSAKNPEPGRRGARLRAQRVWEALHAKNKRSFAALAKEHSDGPFASSGGVVPGWPPGYVPLADPLVVTLSPGETRLKESPYGLHIIRRLK